jgi:hypothetical protein
MLFCRVSWPQLELSSQQGRDVGCHDIQHKNTQHKRPNYDTQHKKLVMPVKF